MFRYGGNSENSIYFISMADDMGVVISMNQAVKKPHLTGDKQGRLTVNDIDQLSITLSGVLANIQNTYSLLTEVREDCKVMRETSERDRLQLNGVVFRLDELRREFDPVKAKVEALTNTKYQLTGAKTLLVIMSNIITFILSYFGFHGKL